MSASRRLPEYEAKCPQEQAYGFLSNSQRVVISEHSEILPGSSHYITFSVITMKRHPSSSKWFAHYYNRERRADGDTGQSVERAHM
jgi:hypothetical protein